ncbi:MAG: putative capsid protein [Circoviridae sp.]|nr:MAG: putative capsid protein [Circoviridae sp.]
MPKPVMTRVRVDRSGSKVKIIRTPRSPRSGLNKTEKKQTKKIVAAAIKKEHALKYFNSDGTTSARAPASSTVGNVTEVSVIGYSSTTEFDNTGSALKYGSQDLAPLYLSRPFKENAPVEAHAEQALDGQYCLPKIARTAFSIERVRYIAESDATADMDPYAARTLPISYRIIKVGFKAQIGTETTVNPNLDLFTDRYGQPTGIDQDGFHRLDCRNLNINTKKYVKLMDMRGTIQQNNIFNPNQATAVAQSHNVTEKQGKSMVHMTVPFQLSARKNGKLFYQTPQQAGAGPNTFTSGGKRELLLFHFWYDNGHALLGSEVGGVTQPVAPTLDDIQIKSHSTSAFVDAN